MIKWLTFSSKAIKGFPMGDPHQRTFPVYLPPNYDAKRSEPYPVLFLLAGFGSRGSKYVWDESVFQLPLPSLLDQAINEQSMQPAIIVFPDAASKLGGSQYINSPALGNYMDYVADELTQFIDEQFHTHRSSQFRGIAGHSSGGFGALVMGMLRPDAFASICSSAGDSCFELCFLPGVTGAVNDIAQAGGVSAFIDYFLSQPNPSALGGQKFITMMTLAMAPCFAPNVKQAEVYGDLFFDLETGAIIPEIWQKYLEWDPVRMVDRYANNLRQLRRIHLAAGLQDEYGLQLGHRQIAAKLKKINIPYELEEYPGQHSGHAWRFVRHFSVMLDQMKQ